MSRLTVTPDNAPGHPAGQFVDPDAIAAELARRGVVFERHSLPVLPPQGGEAVLDALADVIAALKGRFGYVSADVVKVTPETPNHSAMRTKFLAEHTHGEDECRLMLDGGGSFFLHLGAEVLQVEVAAGDLITVPAGAKHWFDMGAQPSFAALRLFTNPDGWVATFTGDAIASRFPAHGEA